MKRIVKYKDVQFWVEQNTALESNFWENYTIGKWEKVNLDFLLNNIRKGYFLDIGSWIGPVSLLMSPFYEKVIAVDFDPIAIKSFNQNISLNNITNIYHYPIGLGDQEKEMEIDGDNLGESTTNLFSKNSQNKVKVKLKRFTDFIQSIPNSSSINFIKIDCEGAEYLFLDQVYDYMKKPKIMAIISYHPWVIGKPRYFFVKIYHWLRQLPFRRYYFTKDGEIIIKEPMKPMFNLYDKFPMADVLES